MTGVSKTYLNKKLRVGKLDSALLFMSSTVGLMFAVIRAAINPATSIVASIPLIVLGIVLPFHYGYVRGALLRSSTVDRYRGWIFFLVGLGAYGYSITVQWMNQVLPMYAGRVSYLADVPIAVVAVLAAYVVARRFHRFIFQVLGERSSPLIVRAALNAAMSALFFAAVSSNVATNPNLELTSGGPLVLLFAAGIYLLRVSERYANYANSNVQYSVDFVTGRWYGKGLPSWSGSVVHTAGLFLFLVGTLYFVTTTPTAGSVIDFFFELVASIILIIAGSLLSRFVGKKEALRVH